MQSDSQKTKYRYNRIAPYFDLLESFLEGLLIKRWRQILWQKVNGNDILEVGVGTGKNFPYYPEKSKIVALDFSEKMLQQAKRKPRQPGVDLVLMDVESLCYADNSFDTIVATFVFCSVPRPIKGLQELYRVCKPGGQVLLLEHVLSSKRLVAMIMRFINPLIVRLFGANINRQTVKSVKSCGFRQVILDSASTDMVKLIQAIK